MSLKKPETSGSSELIARSLPALRLALFSLLGTACAHKPPVYNGPISEIYDEKKGRTESVLIEGNRDFGEVVHVRQIHGHRDLRHPDNKFEVARYQEQILNELLEVGPRAILSELMYYSNKGGETAYDCHLTESGENMDCFFDYVKESLTPEQKAVLTSIETSTELAFLSEEEQELLNGMLLDLGADIIYGYIKGFENIDWIVADSVQDRDDYEYYKTLVQDLDDEWGKKALSRLLKKSIKANERRESVSSEHVLDYLKGHPGSEVYVIYGAAHDFYDDFSRSKLQPYFKEVVYESDLLDPKKRGNEQLFESLISYIE